MDTPRCGSCGYRHAPGSSCPVCQCGAPPAEHDILDGERGCRCGCTYPWAAHELPDGDGRRAIFRGEPCPGRRSATSGQWLRLRQASFKPEPEQPVFREWFGMSVPAPTKEPAAAESEPAPALAPLIAARPPVAPCEIAGAKTGKQAVGLGAAARAAGMTVTALYWQAGDHSEGCAVLIAAPHGARAVATWKRPPGHAGELTGWLAGVGYAWGPDCPLTKTGHSAIQKMIGDVQ